MTDLGVEHLSSPTDGQYPCFAQGTGQLQMALNRRDVKGGSDNMDWGNIPPPLSLWA